MSSNQYADVIQFNRTVIGLEPTRDFNLTPERFDWFRGVINEELDELSVACKEGSAADRLDALIDLIYFAYGRIYEIGIMPLEFQDCWNKVHRANLAKVVGNKGRGSDCDAIKPEGWESPEKDFNLSPEMTIPLVEKIYDIAQEQGFIQHGAVTGRIPCDKPNYSSPPSEDKLGALAPNNGGPNVEELFINEYHNGIKETLKNASQGKKDDDGKIPVGRFLRDFKDAILEVARVWAFGANHYGPGNWKGLENGEERYGDAEIRHFLEGDTCDEASKLLHATHKAWNALAELSFILKRKGKNYNG
jgi:hypothetical protein